MSIQINENIKKFYKKWNLIDSKIYSQIETKNFAIFKPLMVEEIKQITVGSYANYDILFSEIDKYHNICNNMINYYISWLFIIDIVDSVHDIYKKNPELVKLILPILIDKTLDKTYYAFFKNLYNTKNLNNTTYKYPFRDIIDRLCKGGVSDSTKTFISKYIPLKDINFEMGLYMIYPDDSTTKMFTFQDTSEIINKSPIRITKTTQNFKSIPLVYISDNARNLDTDVINESGGLPRNGPSSFLQDIVNKRKHIHNANYDGLSNSELKDSSSKGIIYEEIDINFTLDNIPFIVVDNRVIMFGQDIILNQDNGSVSCKFIIDIYQFTIICKPKGNTINNMWEIIYYFYKGLLNDKHPVIYNNFRQEFYDKMNNISIISNDTLSIKIGVLTIIFNTPNQNVTEIKTKFLLSCKSDEFIQDFALAIINCALSFKRIGDRIPIFKSIMDEAILDTEDTMVRIYNYFLVKYISFYKEYIGELSKINIDKLPIIFRNTNTYGNLSWRKKYIKYKNKYLKLKKLTSNIL